MIFLASKLAWMVISPGHLLVLALVLGAVLSSRRAPVAQKLGRRITLTATGVFFIIAVFPVGDWALKPLEDRFPPQRPDHVDGVIMIGGDEHPNITAHRGQPSMLEAARRYLVFAELARRYPQAQLVFSGGSGRLVSEDATLKDAEVARQTLNQIGVPTERMIFEDRSRTTHENATFSADLIHPRPDQTWLLVTSAFHMPRAMACFRAAGWPVLPAPAGYMTSTVASYRPTALLSEHLYKLTFAIHEYYGLVTYWLAGYIASPWPQA